MQHILCDRVPPGFDVSKELAKAFLAQLKTVPLSRWLENQGRLMRLRDLGPFADLLEDFMFYSRQMELKYPQEGFNLLEEAERVMFQRHIQRRKGRETEFVGLAIYFELYNFVSWRIETEPGLLRHHKAPLLDFVLLPTFKMTKYPGFGALKPEKVRLLLEAGADPNQPKAFSTWQNFAARVTADGRRGHRMDPETRKTIDILLQHGADKSFTPQEPDTKPSSWSIHIPRHLRPPLRTLKLIDLPPHRLPLSLLPRTETQIPRWSRRDHAPVGPRRPYVQTSGLGQATGKIMRTSSTDALRPQLSQSLPESHNEP